MTGLESCRDKTEREFFFDGLTRANNPALVTYLRFPGSPVSAEVLATEAQAGTVVVPPENKASVLVREVVSLAIGRIEADRVLEEWVRVDVVDLVYRPVYAFRYHHAGKEGSSNSTAAPETPGATALPSSSIWARCWSPDSCSTSGSRRSTSSSPEPNWPGSWSSTVFSG